MGDSLSYLDNLLVGERNISEHVLVWKPQFMLIRGTLKLLQM